jgi:hypothetical protein
MIATAATKSVIIAPKTIQPWRRLSTMRPYVAVRLAGMMRMASISTKLESHVGFSYGWAELTLKKPPPFVPSSLMASCEPTAPSDSDWITPWETSTRPTTIDSGSST